MSSAGPDGETGQPSLWRRLRKSQESLSQTAVVSGDGETEHIKKQDELQCDRLWEMLVVLLKTSHLWKKMCLQVTDNISQNTILEYVMINSIFEAILQASD